MILEILTILYIIGIGCTLQAYKDDLKTAGIYPLLFFITSPILILIKLGILLTEKEI